VYLPGLDTTITVLVLDSYTIFKVGVDISKVKVQQIASCFRDVPEAEFHAHSKLKILYCILDIKSHVFFV